MSAEEFVATSAKVVDRAEFARRLLAAREDGRDVVFTNGCFDILHVGHLRYLEAARSQGDLLAVAVNSDTSVKRLKGETRPLVPEDERQEMLAGLACVDLVTSFHEDTPFAIIGECRPRLLVKGADWAGNVVGSDLVEADGGRVELVKLVPGRSSTGLMARAAAAARREAEDAS